MLHTSHMTHDQNPRDIRQEIRDHAGEDYQLFALIEDLVAQQVGLGINEARLADAMDGIMADYMLARTKGEDQAFAWWAAPRVIARYTGREPSF